MAATTGAMGCPKAGVTARAAAVSAPRQPAAGPSPITSTELALKVTKQSFGFGLLP